MKEGIVEQTTQDQPISRELRVEVVQAGEPADVALAVRHYVRMALAQIGLPAVASRSAA